MDRAFFKDLQTGFRLVEVLGEEPGGQARIRDDGRERTCPVSALYAVDELSLGVVGEMTAHAKLREDLGRRDMALARRMPPYRFGS